MRYEELTNIELSVLARDKFFPDSPVQNFAGSLDDAMVLIREIRVRGRAGEFEDACMAFAGKLDHDIPEYQLVNRFQDFLEAASLEYSPLYYLFFVSRSIARDVCIAAIRAWDEYYAKETSTPREEDFTIPF